MKTASGEKKKTSGNGNGNGKGGDHRSVTAAIKAFSSDNSIGDISVITREAEIAMTETDEGTSFLKIPFSVKEETRTVPIAKIIPMKGQPRSFFHEHDIEDLGKSIKKIGQLEKIKAIELPDGNYLCIDGERRYRSQLKKGVTHVKIEVKFFERPLTKDELYLLSACYNSNRVNHNPAENVRIVRRIMAMSMCKNASKLALAREISVLLGYSVGYVGHCQKIAEANPQLTEMIDYNLPEHKRLNFTSAMHISYEIADPEKQLQIAKISVEKKLSVRQTKMMATKAAVNVKKKSEKPRPSKLSNSLDAFIRQTGEWVDHFLDVKSALREAIAKLPNKKDAKLSLYSIADRIRELGDGL